MTRTRPAPVGSGPAVTLAVVPSAEGAAITGPAADVTALLQHLRGTGADLTAVTGHELHITLPARTATGHREGARTRSRDRLRVFATRRALVVAAVLAAITVVAGLVWAVALAVAWVIAHLAAIGAGLIVLAVLAAVTGGGACTTVVRITHHH